MIFSVSVNHSHKILYIFIGYLFLRKIITAVLYAIVSTIPFVITYFQEPFFNLIFVCIFRMVLYSVR